MKKIKDDLVKYYSQNLADHGSSAKGVGWKSTEAQFTRFEQLVKIIKNKTDFSINDLGCGVGNLFDYLKENDYQNLKYTGYDMLESMITEGKNLHLNEQEASFLRIENSNQLLPADYTVASGVFNLKYGLAEYEWLNIILETIHQMDKFSHKGFAFNMLTKYSDKEYMQKHLYYADPLFMFDYCKRNYSRNVALLHDYEEYDFTILVRK